MESTQNHTSDLRRYLLGDVEEDEACDIGERMLLEDDYLDKVERSEDELIEDYLDDALSAEERRRFENHTEDGARGGARLGELRAWLG